MWLIRFIRGLEDEMRGCRIHPPEIFHSDYRCLQKIIELCTRITNYLIKREYFKVSDDELRFSPETLYLWIYKYLYFIIMSCLCHHFDQRFQKGQFLKSFKNILRKQAQMGKLLLLLLWLLYFSWMPVLICGQVEDFWCLGKLLQSYCHLPLAWELCEVWSAADRSS